MKKLISTVLAVAMILSLSVNAFAKNVTEDGGTDAATVKATYVEGLKAADVLSADITWGALEFTYTAASQGEWDADSLKYINIVPASWSCNDGADKIKVENRGNVKVKVSVSAAPQAGYDAVNVDIYSKDSLGSPVLSSTATLEAADIPGAKTITEFTVNPSGDIDSTTPAATPISTVTVKINKLV